MSGRPGIALLLALNLAHGAAHALRDPMEPPALAAPSRAVSASPPTATTAMPPAELPVVRHIVSAAGQHHVVMGARRLGAGDRLGDLRIECVHAAGLWARDEAGVRRHLPLYRGVAVRPAADAHETTTSIHTPPATCAGPDTPSSKRKSP